MSGVDLDAERLARLLDVGRALVSELDLETLLRRILEVAAELTGARYVALGILDEDRRELERFITLGISDETRKEIGELPRGRGVLGILISDPCPLRLADVAKHPRSYGFPPGHPKMESFLGVPIMIRGRAYGNLYLTEKRGGDFSEADEQAVVILSEWAGIAIDNARSVAEERLRRSIEASERERSHWARELHDETLQALGALRVQLGSGLQRGSPQALEQAVRNAVAQLASDIQSLRRLIAELRPAALDEIGVEAAIQGLVERITATEGVIVDAELELSGGDDGQGTERTEMLDSTIYRVVQEALTNVGKHARAEHVRLRVSEQQEAIEISIADDGVGFDPDRSHTGFGLQGMRERVAMFGGSLDIDSSPGTGTRIRAVIPAGGRVRVA